ncbi:MAG: WD40 repeat domain-containing protein [Proteobacteria bacterium]|nr:MAG: WD40 repeat domain-containing protein [Pseudomonadota bacterium]
MAKNSFEQLGLISSEGDQIEVRSAAFLRDDGRDEGSPQLYFVGNTGKLFRWSVSKRTRPILLDNFISRPAETWLQMMPRIRQKDSDSFWLLGINELSIISTDDQLTTHSLEVISPLPAFLRDWSWSKDDKSITLLTDQSKVGYKEYPNADFLRTGVVNLERNQFSSMIHHPLFDVTIDRNHYARIWHQKDALGSFVVSNREAYRMDWLDENRIGVVSGDDSAALWSRDGQLIQRFRNEGIQGLLYFIWNETKDRFVTIGKDDDIHVWAVDGTYLQRLPDPDQGEAFDVESSPSVAVFASDQRTIITSGQINFTIWRLGDDQQYQIAKKISGRHPLDHDFVEPSQLKVFSWKGKDVVFASRLIGMPKTIQFFDLEGEPSKLWPDILTTVKNATLSKDGRFLALIDLEGFGAEYELGEAGFQLRGPKFPIEKEIEYMSYSPDGQTLLGFSGNQKLRIWSHEDGHAIPVLNDHSTPLHKGEFDSVTWWPDSEKFVFINGNSVLVLTKKGEILTQFSPSGPNKVITRLSLNGSDLAIMSYAPDEAYYSGKETRSEIKIISFDLNVQKQKLCAAIQNFLSLSNDFDRLPNMNIKDRGLCFNQ